MSPLVLNLVFVGIFWIIFLWSRRHLYRLAWEIGGPIGLPLIGCFIGLGKMGDFIENLKSNIWSKYKSPCTIWFGTRLHLMVRDPQTARDILTSTDFLDKSMHEPFEIILGKNNILSVEEKIWKLHRKAVDPAFSYQNINRLVPVFNKAVSEFITNILKPMAGKGEVDIQKSLEKLFADLAFENTAGQTLNLLYSSHGDVTFIDHVDKVQRMCSERSLKFYLHNNFIFKFTKLYQKVLESNAKIHQVLRELYHKRLDSNANRRYTSGDSSILEYLKQRNGEWTFSEKDILFDMGTIMIASYQTTSLAIFLTLFYLAQYPKHQQKVFEELFSIFPEKNPQVDLTNLKDMVYTEMVINEVLRLHPSVIIIGRKATKDTRLSTGQFIPKGTQVLLDLFHLHRNENIWGPNADNFDPDNFLPERVELLPPAAFIPFSYGMRNCIGIRYAKIVLKIAIAKLVRTYELKTSWAIKDVIFLPGMITTIENNPLIAIEQRLK